MSDRMRRDMNVLRRSTQIGKVTTKGSGVGGKRVEVGRRIWMSRRLANVTGEGDKAIVIDLLNEAEIADGSL
jgi:hypothetical protein